MHIPLGTKMNTTESKFIPFPMVLHELLKKCERGSFGDIISWQPHGLAFKIRKRDEFIDIILPRFFKHKQIKSFMRQLYYYGFHRITQGVDKDCYHHVLFRSNNKFLARGIIRKTRKVKITNSTLEHSQDLGTVFTSFQEPIISNRDLEMVNASKKHHDDNLDHVIQQIKNESDLNICARNNKEQFLSMPSVDTSTDAFSCKDKSANFLNINKLDSDGIFDYPTPNDRLKQYEEEFSLMSSSYNMQSSIVQSSSISLCSLADDNTEKMNTRDTEVDLYAPNLKRTSIYMDTLEDDLQFSLVLESLS